MEAVLNIVQKKDIKKKCDAPFEYLHERNSLEDVSQEYIK